MINLQLFDLPISRTNVRAIEFSLFLQGRHLLRILVWLLTDQAPYKRNPKRKDFLEVSEKYEGALGPHTLLFLLIVISKFRLTISKFRHNKSKFRLNNSKFRLNILKFRLIISKFRHKISKFRFNNSKFRVNNSKFRLNVLKFRLIISKFQHDISSWFFVCNSTPGNLVKGSRWLCKMKVFPAIWTMKNLFNISNTTHCNLRLLWNTQDVKFP